MTGPLRPPRDWFALAVLAGVLGWCAWRGGPWAGPVLLHWPLLAILTFGYTRDLKGGLIASAAACAVVVALEARGLLGGWVITGWELLILSVFGLYPFKFMQIREERRHHFRTLVEYKLSEIGGLKERTEALDRRCRELEAGMRAGAAT